MSSLKTSTGKMNYESQAALSQTGVLISDLGLSGEESARFVVEDVGVTNEIEIFGKIRNQATYQSLAVITGATTGTTIDISSVDFLKFVCNTFDPSGGSPRLVASGFFNSAAGDAATEQTLQNVLSELETFHSDNSTENDAELVELQDFHGDSTAQNSASLSEAQSFHSDSNSKLDTLIANTDTLEVNTDGLETLITETNSKLDTLISQTDTLEANTDGLEGLITSTNTKLDTGNASLAAIDIDTSSIISNQTNGTQKSQTVDGVGNIQPALDTVARSGFMRLTDGTNTMAVKAASTAALVTDPAAVVSISPNSPIPTGTNNIGSITNVTGTVSLPTGASTSANQTTELTRLGDVTETAPATDTASSGLNGRLQRVAQNITRLTLAQASTTSGQTGPLVQGAVTTADPTYTTAQTDPLSLTTTGRLRSDITGNVASAATDSGNPVKTGGIVNLSGSLFTNAQRADTQMNASASAYVDISGRLPTYGAFSSFVTAATATDIFTITGSSTKTVKIRSIVVSGTNSGNTNALVIMLKRSTANSGGTSSTLTAVPYDSNNAAATAVARSYTVNPTTGTLVGNIEGEVIFLPTLASTNVVSREDTTYGNDGGQPIVLRGTGEVFAVNLNGVALLGTTVMNIAINWTEE